jgi:hypothetical protein
MQEFGIMDRRLEEQLERMRQLNEQLQEIHRGVSQNNEIIARDLARSERSRGEVAVHRPHRRRRG